MSSGPEGEMREYLEKHQIHSLFTKIVEDLLATTPENPLQAIVDFLGSEYGVVSSFRGSPINGGKGSREKEVIEDQDEEDEEQSSDDDDEDEDENDVNPVSMVNFARTSDNLRNSRRASVSAGVIQFGDAAHTKPIVFDKTKQEAASIKGYLRNNPLFMQCASESLDTIAAAMEKCSFPPKCEIITQGDTQAEHFFIVESGTCSVFIQGKHIRDYGHADTFGELALLYNQPRSATIRSVTSVTAWRLDQHTFKTIVVHKVMEKRNLYIDFLKGCSFLQELKEIELMTLADSLERRKYTNKQTIITQGDVGKDFYILLEGKVDVIRDGKYVGPLKPGAYFGEIALMFDKPRQASVIASADLVQVLAMDRKTFQRLMGPLGHILGRNPLHLEFICS
mmetsp:Transcript_2351/g.4592  ORF Transcript_2351/g.4592 Transcript_2351/m.4592 type:complete len:394 (-) Transcript_2351:29-1210(-)